MAGDRLHVSTRCWASEAIFRLRHGPPDRRQSKWRERARGDLGIGTSSSQQARSIRQQDRREVPCHDRGCMVEPSVAVDCERDESEHVTEALGEHDRVWISCHGCSDAL